MTEPLVFETPTDQEGFTQIPNAVLMDTRLSVQARFLYGVLRRFAWQKDACWPGQAVLAEVMGGVTERSIRNYVVELERSFLVRRESQGPKKTCRYVLLAIGIRERRISQAEMSFRKPVSGPGGNEFPPEEDSEKKTQILSEGARASARLKIAGKNVDRPVWALTEQILAEFNRQAGKKLRLLSANRQPSEAAKRIYGRVRQYSDLKLEDYEDIIRRTLASRWWGDGEPTIGVVFGPNVFEDNITRPGVSRNAKKAERDKRAEEDMAAMQRVIERARAA